MRTIIGTNDIIKNRYIRYELTGQCNFSCKYCSYRHTFNKTEHSKVWKETVQYINRYNALSKFNNQLMLWGGEPTLHPHFFDICKLSKVPFGLYTNFSKDIDFFLELYSYELFQEIYISIHLDQDKSISKTLNSIEKMFEKKRNNILIRLAVMLEEEHINECIDIFNILNSEYNKFTVLKAVDTEGNSYYKTNLLDFNKYMKEHQYIIVDGKKYTRFDIIQNNLDFKKCFRFLCNCPSKVIHIDSQGNIFNCLVFDENNKPISSIYSNNIKQLENKNKLCPCKNCYNYLLKSGKRKELYVKET